MEAQAANDSGTSPANGSGVNPAATTSTNAVSNSPNPHSQSTNQARPDQRENSKVSGKFFLAIVIMLVIVLFKGLSANIKRR
jgi:hypothetical protein